MTQTKDSLVRTLAVVLASFVFLIMGSAGLLQIVVDQTPALQFRFPRDEDLRFFFAPLGVATGMSAGIILHELAHAWMARLVGGHVFHIQLGSGGKLGSFRFAGFQWMVHRPTGFGAVHYGLLTEHRTRLKMWLVTAAAPVVSVLLAATSVAAAYSILQRPEYAIAHPRLLTFLVGWTGAVLMVLPGTLLPFPFQNDGRQYHTDAWTLLKRPSLSRNSIRTFVESTKVQVKYGRGPLTADSAFALAEGLPDDPKVLFVAAQVLRGYNDRRALQVLRRLVAIPTFTPAERIERLDHLLTTALDFDAVSELPDVEALVDELSLLNFNNASTRGTIASLWVDLGRQLEAVPILTELSRSDDKVSRFYSLLFLAIAEEKLGNPEVAQRHAQAAREVGLEGIALSRVAKLLGPPS